MRCSHPRLVWKSTYGELLRAPGSASNGLVLPGTLRWAEKGRVGCFANHWATCRETGNHKKKQNNREIDAEGAAAEWRGMGSLAPPGALPKLLVKNALCGRCYQSQTFGFRPSSVAETATQRGFQCLQGEGRHSFHCAGHTKCSAGPLLQTLKQQIKHGQEDCSSVFLIQRLQWMALCRVGF